MSNVYKHRNCLMLNLWNCNWDNKLPEIDGHAKVVMNVITTQFRMWLRPKCVNGVWSEAVEIVDYPEHVRQYVLRNVRRRLDENCCPINPTGAWHIDDLEHLRNCHIDDMQFIVENYVGNYSNPSTQMPNLFELRYKTDKPYFPPFIRRPDLVTVSRP